jgi:hypothetical protein
VKGKFIDERKEQEYQKNKGEETKNWVKNHPHKYNTSSEGQAYNIINMGAVHEGRLYSLENRNKEMKRRFDVKFENEKYNNDKQIAQKTQKDNYLNNKFSYNKFKQQDARGYNILTQFPNKTEYRDTLKLKDTRNEWEILLDKRANQTSKGIYKHHHDVCDNVKIKKDFIDRRNGKI